MDRGKLVGSMDEKEYESRIGSLFILLTKIIKHRSDSVYQGPHWDHEPTPEELRNEVLWQENANLADLEADRLACKLFFDLTGVKVQEHLKFVRDQERNRDD